MLLVHGVFGSGKSALLVVCVLLIARVAALAGESGAAVRVLIASATNVAVDRILLALLDAAFDDFLRVGSLRKIARRVLCKSVHRSRDDADDEKNERDAARDLQALLTEA